MKQRSVKVVANHLRNDLEAATSRAVHDGLPFVQIARMVVQAAVRITNMIEIAQRLDREELARAKRKKRVVNHEEG